MAVIKLVRIGLVRSIAAVCLSLEITANASTSLIIGLNAHLGGFNDRIFRFAARILYGIDPFGGWEMMPIAFCRIFATTSVPITIASVLLFTFYWQELVSGSLIVSPFLTRSKIPAAILITCLMILEIISSSLRGAEVTWNILTSVTGYVMAV
jgi:hypothetical protein